MLVLLVGLKVRGFRVVVLVLLVVLVLVLVLVLSLVLLRCQSCRSRLLQSKRLRS